ncbi:MAG: SURF1 family protein [Alphaproteobacteria bacterium]|nr:SURF1 family protein [Alphaproteobacteria bacterium]
MSEAAPSPGDRGPRRLFWPTTISLGAVLITASLGIWQVQRLHWKTALIADRQARVEAPALAELPADAAAAQAAEFRRIKVTGSFRHEREAHLAATTDRGNVGFQIITPFRLANGREILINRGWVPTARRDAATRAAGQVAGEVTIEGLIRPGGKPGWFAAPPNDVRRNLWIWLDLEAISAELGVSPAPAFIIDAGPAPNPGGLPLGGQTRVALPNDHWQYALTWFGLSAVFAIMYVIYWRQNR